MLELLWLIPALPLASFLVLALVGPRLSRNSVAVFGAGSVGASAVVSLLVARALLETPRYVFTQELWTWIDVAGFTPSIGFHLDALALVMVLVITGVGFWIHLYSVEFMREEEGYNRFFAYMNLFVGSMVTLVLADNLLLLYLGWEGVGLCSYLLIGFWYRDPANGRAARKAFIVTRVGDTAMAIGLFLLFHTLGTLHIQEVLWRASEQWLAGSGYAAAAAALLLGGAVGKSAQLPLQTWLPDAMAGPTPTSALIHAATMVTAGVYLIARTHTIFELAPVVQFLVAVVGAVTLLLAGFSALTQSDIKRVLAYSTISQIGYMFLALGVGAWAAAMFHFMTHAFFKALLFLAAGAVILAVHHEHNIFRMGGLRKDLPVTFWSFLIGGSALAGLPLVTAGFYSKGLILWETLASEKGGTGLWLAGLAGVFLTSLYIYRVIFIVFFGEPRSHTEKKPGRAILLPLVVLSVFSIVGGFVELPHYLADVTVFSGLLGAVLPAFEQATVVPMTELSAEAAATLAFLAGLFFAYFIYLRRPGWAEAAVRTRPGQSLHRWWFAHWGFDWLYERLFVRPVVWLAEVDKDDFIDALYAGLSSLTQLAWSALRVTQTGRVRWYAAGMVVGALLFMAVVTLLR